MTTRTNILVILIFGSFLNACTVQTIVAPAPEHRISIPDRVTAATTDSPMYWWYARFKMVWAEQNEKPDFADNLIIAHQIINPVLERHYEGIKLWRFHRRAAKDTDGHQFAFIFYASTDTAQNIFEQIRNNPLSQQLVNEKIIEAIRLDNPEKPTRPDIEDTSDKNWSLPVQKSWPYYIMGVSILWLDLLNQEAIQEQLDTASSLQTQLPKYRRISEQLTEHWKSQGRHAFFHHINGIFAYEALEMSF